MSKVAIVTWARLSGGLAALAGAANLLLAPFVSRSVFGNLWGVEPLSYVGSVLVMIGLGLVGASYVAGDIIARKDHKGTLVGLAMFQHEFKRPVDRIGLIADELRVLLSYMEEEIPSKRIPTPIRELLDELRAQVGDFRLTMENIHVLAQLEARSRKPREIQAVDPSAVLQNIVDRYYRTLAQCQKRIVWWAEPDEFGFAYSDAEAIERIVTNLVDNAARWATQLVEIRLSRNAKDFFISVCDDGPGIDPKHLLFVFDRGWTPAVLGREPKYSAGLGLYIAKALVERHGGEIGVESVTLPHADHHTTFTVRLPLGARE